MLIRSLALTAGLAFALAPNVARDVTAAQPAVHLGRVGAPVKTLASTPNPGAPYVQQHFACTVESPYQYDVNNPPVVRTYTTTSAFELDSVGPVAGEQQAILQCQAQTGERPGAYYFQTGTSGCATNYGDSYYWEETETPLGLITLDCWSDNPPPGSFTGNGSANGWGYTLSPGIHGGLDLINSKWYPKDRLYVNSKCVQPSPTELQTCVSNVSGQLSGLTGPTANPATFQLINGTISQYYGSGNGGTAVISGATTAHFTSGTPSNEALTFTAMLWDDNPAAPGKGQSVLLLACPNGTPFQACNIYSNVQYAELFNCPQSASTGVVQECVNVRQY